MRSISRGGRCRARRGAPRASAWFLVRSRAGRAGMRARATASARRSLLGGCALRAPRAPRTPLPRLRGPAATSMRPSSYPDSTRPQDCVYTTAAINKIPTEKVQKRRDSDAPTIRDEHSTQLLHPDAVAPKEHVERHRPPDVLIDLPHDDATITVRLRQKLRKHAGLLHLESVARLEPHLGAVRERHPAAEEPAELPALLARCGSPEMRDADQPVAVSQLVLGDWPFETQQRRCTARSRWGFGRTGASAASTAATTTAAAARRRRRRQRLRPGTPPRAHKGVPLLALCRLSFVVDNGELFEQTPQHVRADVPRCIWADG